MSRVYPNLNRAITIVLEKWYNGHGHSPLYSQRRRFIGRQPSRNPKRYLVLADFISPERRIKSRPTSSIGIAQLRLNIRDKISFISTLSERQVISLSWPIIIKDAIETLRSLSGAILGPDKDCLLAVLLLLIAGN